MKQNIKLILKTLSQRKYLLIAIVFSLLFLSVFLYFTDVNLMIGNLGYTHTLIYISLSALAILFFGLYVSLLAFRWDERKKLSAQVIGSGIAGTGASVLVTGCVACSITLASYLGLASVIALLPFYGLELTALGIGFLLFSIKKLSDEKTLSCEVKK